MHGGGDRKRPLAEFQTGPGNDVSPFYASQRVDRDGTSVTAVSMPVK